MDFKDEVRQMVELEGRVAPVRNAMMKNAKDRLLQLEKYQCTVRESDYKTNKRVVQHYKSCKGFILAPSHVQKWVVVYPAYIDKSLTRAQGRKIPLKHCCENPSVEALYYSCQQIKFNAVMDPKHYSRRPWERGRVLVDMPPTFNDPDNPEDQTELKGRKALYRIIAAGVPSVNIALQDRRKQLEARRRNDEKIAKEAEAAAKASKAKAKDSMPSLEPQLDMQSQMQEMAKAMGMGDLLGGAGGGGGGGNRTNETEEEERKEKRKEKRKAKKLKIVSIIANIILFVYYGFPFLRWQLTPPYELSSFLANPNQCFIGQRCVPQFFITP